MYTTFVDEDNICWLMNPQPIYQCEAQFNVAKKEVSEFSNDLAKELVSLCDEWIGVCSELRGVRMYIF